MTSLERAIAMGDEDLDRLFQSCATATAIVAAVSGGPDSMALMQLLARWWGLPARPGQSARPPILVATVDHGLRPEAAAEVALVAEEAARLGLAHRALAWSGPKPKTGLQEAAREARYRLLIELARAEGASHLLTAHTLDDQAETILMRIARGSGLTGLAGMRRAVDRDGIQHVRPLLDARKADLVNLCRAEGWRFVEDSSNADDRYARVRWRRLMPALAAEGLTAERLARLADRAGRVEDALEEKAGQAFAKACRSSEDGIVRLSVEALVEEPFEIAGRVLVRALVRAGGGVGPRRLRRLEDCTAALRAAAAARQELRRTLAGMVVFLDGSGQVTVAREPPRRRGRYQESVSDDAAAPPHSLGKGGEHA